MSDSPLHVYCIEWASFRAWCVATDAKSAWLWCFDLADSPEDMQVRQLPDDFPLTSRCEDVDTGVEEEFTQTCAEWAKGGEGYLFSA
jgi:hypothetical protein